MGISWTDKQQRFVEEYTEDFNASAAARRAGYSEKTAGQMGYENLKKPEIREAIKERLEKLSMSAEEATKHMADIARIDMAEFYTIVEDEDGDRYARLDLVKLLEEGPSHLVKKIKPTKWGLQIESYDRQSALETILKGHGKLGARGTEDDPVHVRQRSVNVDLAELEDIESPADLMKKYEDLFSE